MADKSPFKLIVENDDDVVSLLAYALYKQLEDEYLDKNPGKHDGYPAPTDRDVKWFRNNACLALEEYTKTAFIDSFKKLNEDSDTASLVKALHQEVARQGHAVRQIGFSLLSAFLYALILLGLMAYSREFGDGDLSHVVSAYSTPPKQVQLPTSAAP